jgi:hypothetical protein
VVQTDRHFLSATAQALVAQRGSNAERRSFALVQAGQRCEPAALSFEMLGELPDWMRAPRQVQADMARRIALLAMGPALARSIDGGWLTALADVAGEDALDWAIDNVVGDAEDGADVAITVAPDRLEATGFGLAAATLPPPLRPLMDWARPETIDPHHAAHAPKWLAAARDALA